MKQQWETYNDTVLFTLEGGGGAGWNMSVLRRQWDGNTLQITKLLDSPQSPAALSKTNIHT
jgi:hypothetical protein